MRKIGKKFSFLTKIMLVIGLIISDLSSLTVVFASEAKVSLTVVEDKLNIKYLEELADEVEKVRINVYENYTYLDGTKYVDEVTLEEIVESNYDLTPEEVLILTSTLEDEALVLDSILPEVVFDGVYEVTVKIVDATDAEKENWEVLNESSFDMAVNHDGGFKYALYEVVDEETDNLLEKNADGKYEVAEDTNVKVVAKMLAGGFKPTDKFMVGEATYTAKEILDLGFESKKDFAGYLFGEYALPVDVNLCKVSELECTNVEIPVEERTFSVLYETYSRNAERMNLEAMNLGFDESYMFAMNNTDGIVYVRLLTDKVNTMLDLYNVLKSLYGENEKVNFVLSNSDYEDVIASYNELVGDITLDAENVEETVTLEEYLSEIVLNDSVKITVKNEGLAISYQVVVSGDMNNDNKITNDDLLNLIEQVVGNKDSNALKADIYGNDGLVNTLDIMYLDQVVKSGNWNTEIKSLNDVKIDSALEVLEKDIVSGQKFTVNYIVNLKDYAVNGLSGLFSYDKDSLELLTITMKDGFNGSVKEDNFLMISDESLELSVLEETEEGSTENTEEEPVLEPIPYVVVTAEFMAKKAGEHSVNVKNLEFFNQDTYYGVNNDGISTTVLVNASDNNDLSYLKVGDNDIALTEDTLDYEITVKNEVTKVDVVALSQNIAANITSIVAPEELLVGENLITITVEAENGDIKVYTVKVIREDTPKEENTQVSYNNYNYENNYQEPVEENNEVIEEPVVEEEPITEEEEESNLSRIVIIILILLVIAGLIYLIFKDDDEDDTKKINKEVNKLKKEENTVKKTGNKTTSNKTNNNKSNNKKKKK